MRLKISFCLVESFVVTLEVQGRCFLLIVQQFFIDPVEFFEWNSLVPLRQPHEDDHINKHKSRKQEELEGLGAEEFSTGDNDDDKITERYR